MSKSGQAPAMAECTKCRIRHTRPVGVRCRRNLNSSAPVVESVHDSVHMDLQSQPGSSQGHRSTSVAPTHSTSPSGRADASTTHPDKDPMDSKLDLILRKMEKLEEKNSELERKFHGRSPSKSTSRVTHSSPKRTHKCSTSCSSTKHKKSKSHRASNVASFNSSDEFLEESSIQGLAEDSQTADESAAPRDRVSMEYLKANDRVQRQVQRQLEKLQGRSRGASEGNSKFKSGLHRSGDNAVRHIIGWPHHYCFPSTGGKLPEYKDLSPLQFMVGFLGCLQDESSNSIRNNMIEYGRHLFQDALETNWTTAKHAHMVLLQEIERGKCSWRSPDMVEKIRIRNTARIIATKPAIVQHKASKGSKDKICTDFNAGSCSFTADHVVDGVIVKHACSYCHQTVGKLCLHRMQDCIRKKNSTSKDNNKSN